MFSIVIIIVGLFLGVRYIGSVIHYNAVQPAEDAPPPIRIVGDLGFFLTGGSLLPLWNLDATTVMKVTWSIEKANPQIKSEDDYRINEQTIAADVSTLDGTTKRYDLGTAMGCTGKEMNEIEDHKIMLGKVDCNDALTGTRFAAFIQKGGFRIERYDESSKDGSIKTSVLVEL
ncbi:MAG: hypothetical protein G01um10148_1035 [Parcubacteria group bacterium Gr01-1014_8]|nr:MAG: hypothetical protein G01um10148_1035 [Parcubacteria group bacterium Gr01-1014_8]